MIAKIALGVGARKRRALFFLAALIAAAAAWLPLVHLFFTEPLDHFFCVDGAAPLAKALASRHLNLWTQPERREAEIGKMRRTNAEWDFMGRSFFVWSLANLALREPDWRRRSLSTMDRIIEETIAIENAEGLYFFLMPYARHAPFVQQPARSQFLDGEIALMIAMRRLVEEKPVYQPLLAERISLIVERMKAGPALSAESYPDECWLFCNTVALAAIKISDVLDGTDHREFFRAWIERAKQKLLDPQTGLLISSYTFDGRPLDGPEGSSIWMASHCLDLIDAEFARDQYDRARKELFRNFLGFGYAREWPESWTGSLDVDSGAVIPIFEAGIGSSGLLLVAASSFADLDVLSAVHATLELGGFPTEENGGLKYLASNQVGDAVLLYSTVLGPIWREVKRRERS